VLRTPPLTPAGLVFKRKKNMEIKFVTEDEIAEKRGRKEKYPWSEFIEELYKHPNKWAEFPVKVVNSGSAYRVTTKYKDVEVQVTGGNNLTAEDPGKQLWTVYVRYTPRDEETF
jgi:hypothetical protein